MRALVRIALLAGSVLLTAPTMARVSHEQAFNLCITQPSLQADGLAPIIDGELSRPHEPALDTMSRDQILNAIQYTQGNVCAAELVAHPDVFSAISMQQFVSDYDWQGAWIALNSYCRHNLTGTCIKKEVEAGDAIRDANAHGMTPSFRACSLVLTDDTDSVQEERCMNIVGDQRPDDAVVLGCASSVRWHSQKDGAVAGRKIGQCFKRGE